MRLRRSQTLTGSGGPAGSNRELAMLDGRTVFSRIEVAALDHGKS